MAGLTGKNVVKRRLRALELLLEIAREAGAFIVTLGAHGGDSPHRHDTIDMYMHGIRGVLGTFCGIAGAMDLGSHLLQHHSMARSLGSEHTLQKAGGFAGAREVSDGETTSTEKKDSAVTI